MALPAILGALAAGSAAAQFADAISVQNNYSQQFQESLTFPTDLILGNDTPYITFKFEIYKKRSIYETVRTETVNQNGTIRLPVPRNLQDNFSVTYSQENLGPGIGALTNAVVEGSPRAALEQVPGGLALQFGESLLRRAANSQSGGLLSLATGVAAEAGSSIYNAVQSVSGVTPNPFQTILFKNPNFKKHQFSWSFIPKEQQESEKLRKIVETFQYHMLPGISKTASIFFTYPGIVRIFLNPTSKYLYKFKPCVVESFSVNYAPNGPAFYRKTVAPAALNVSITFQEVELWTKNDFLAAPIGGDPSALLPPSIRQLFQNTPGT